MCVKVILNFIDLTLQHCSGAITTLVNIFENVFDGIDARAYFDIDVGFVMFGKIWAVWSNPSIVEPYTFGFDFAPFSFNNFPSSIERIAIFIQYSFITEFLRISLRAFSIFHTWRIWMCWTTWTMHHIA